MKISFNWLRDYLHTDITPEAAAEVLTAIGLEAEGIQTVEAVRGGLKGVVVGEVLTCEKHPDADRLRITTVDLGDGQATQIVCGAPNVAAGQKVLVATVGTTLYPLSGDALTIKKSKIRGAESNGMICAEDELGLGSSHDGILVLDPSAVPGTPAAQQLGISTDHCIEIGLTPNRTDAISHYGVARDLAAALLHMEGRPQAELTLGLPSLEHYTAGADTSALQVEVLDSAACPRYSGLVIDGLTVGPSPKWLQERLLAIGQRPINAVVDITNYVQHEIGQPLHAFDADRIEGGRVIVRKAAEGERFTTLDGVERTLSAEDLMICDAGKPMCIAGVFGGQQSGVTEATTRIFLESAYFHPVSVRKTARRHGLNTDASFRFERGCDPTATLWAMRRAAQLMVEVCGGRVASAEYDLYPSPVQPVEITFRPSFAARLIGRAIPEDRLRDILIALGFTLLEEGSAGWKLHVPHYRVDVTREADVVEEVLRIYGYDNIEFPQGLRSSISIAPKPDPEKVRNQVADLLAARGCTEMMGMSLTKLKYAGLIDDAAYDASSAVHLLNPLSQDLAVMRQSLLWGALEAIASNQNHRNADLRLFEFGKEYRKTESGYHESEHLGIWLTGRRSPENWDTSDDAVSFQDLRALFGAIAVACGWKELTEEKSVSPLLAEGLQWRQGKRVIARLGRVRADLLEAFDVKQPVWFADIDWDAALGLLPKQAIQYHAPEKFPAVRRDLSLLLNKDVSFSEIERLAFDAERKLLREVGLFDVYEGKNLEAGKKSYAVSFVLQDATRTMTDQQVDAAMGRIRKNLEEKLGATLRA